MRRLNALSLRLRLTLATVGVAAVVLAAIGLFIYVDVKSGLDSGLDAQLDARVTALERIAAAGRTGALRTFVAADPEQLQVIGANGRVLLRSRRAPSVPLLRGGELARARRGTVRAEHDERIRLVARRLDGNAVIVAATSMAQRERALETLGGVLLVGGPLVLVLIAAAAYAVAARALTEVDRMRRRAATISEIADAPALPLPAADDELRRLGETLNTMLARLADSARRERAFLQNASHELRTPLAILKAEIELALGGPADPASMRRALASAAEEAERLERLANDLLVVAAGDADRAPLVLQEVALRPLADELAQRFGHVVDSRIDVAIEDDVVVRADPARLHQALLALLDNAVLHGAPPIEMSARGNGAEVVVHVTDHGPGISQDFAAQAFERFSRDSPHGGSGLGLAVVAAIARAHGGEAGADARPEGGADIWISLPAASAESA